MQSILKVMATIGSSESTGFLQEVYKQTSSIAIARQIEYSMKNFGIQFSQRKDLAEGLFVPEVKDLRYEPVSATIQTGQGNILIQLRPDIVRSNSTARGQKQQSPTHAKTAFFGLLTHNHRPFLLPNTLCRFNSGQADAYKSNQAPPFCHCDQNVLRSSLPLF